MISALSKSVVEVLVAIEMKRNERDQTPQRATRRQDSGMPEMDDLKGERDGGEVEVHIYLFQISIYHCTFLHFCLHLTILGT